MIGLDGVYTFTDIKKFESLNKLSQETLYKKDTHLTIRDYKRINVFYVSCNDQVIPDAEGIFVRSSHPTTVMVRT